MRSQGGPAGLKGFELCEIEFYLQFILILPPSPVVPTTNNIYKPSTVCSFSKDALTVYKYELNLFKILPLVVFKNIFVRSEAFQLGI